MQLRTCWPLSGLIAFAVAACASNVHAQRAGETLQLRLSNASLAFPQLELPKVETVFPRLAMPTSKTGDKTVPNPCDVNDNMPTGGTHFDATVRMPNGAPGQQNALGKLGTRFQNAVKMPNPCAVEDTAKKKKSPKG